MERVASTSFWGIGSEFPNKIEISKKKNITVYRSMLVTTFTFGYESWTLSEKHKSTFLVMVMGYLESTK